MFTKDHIIAVNGSKVFKVPHHPLNEEWGLTNLYNFGKSKPRTSPAKAPVQAESAATQPPIRVIVFLEQAPPADKQLLTAAIAEACKCEAIFVRFYSSNAITYQINLAPQQTFSTFKSALLPGDPALGMKAIMQGQ